MIDFKVGDMLMWNHRGGNVGVIVRIKNDMMQVKWSNYTGVYKSLWFWAREVTSGDLAHIPVVKT